MNSKEIVEGSSDDDWGPPLSMEEMQRMLANSKVPPEISGLADAVVRRYTWGEMGSYVGHKYRGREKGRQRTIRIVDVTFGGDVIARSLRQDSVWSQEQFMEFVRHAKRID